ncbi:MAG TPA: iron-containing redox enzyme family protein [Bdellovibrionales bacterium]|nr:iron-containing redox enzyme family protein [Bdellovibrionales bacterium]
MKIRDLVAQEMKKTAEVLWDYPWEDPRAYAMWLAQTYYMVAHSTRLVALAGACVDLDQNNLHARFVDHSREERGHEKICITDLKAIGYELSELPQVYQSASMYQVQYYWIQHRDPIAFFGYTLALECLAENFGGRLHKILLERYGASAAKFIKLHSEADLEHTEAAYEQIDKLSEGELKLVRENLVLSSALYRGMLVEAKAMVQSLPVKKNKAA